jgi:hypothetical protein
MVRFLSLQPILLMTNFCVILQNFGMFSTSTSHCICRLCLFVIIEPNNNRARMSDTLDPSKVMTYWIIALYTLLYEIFYKFSSSKDYDLTRIVYDSAVAIKLIKDGCPKEHLTHQLVQVTIHSIEGLRTVL